MNFKLYVFGESSGYKQYPEDSINFKSSFRNQQSPSQLHIMRKADLVYYIYTQRIDKSSQSFFGFCLIFNGVYIRDIRSAFTILENVCCDCVMNEKFLKRNQVRNFVFSVEELGSQKEEIARITKLFDIEFERNDRALFASLPETYKVGQGTQTLTINDTPEAISDALNFYDSILIPNNSHDEDFSIADSENSLGETKSVNKQKFSSNVTGTASELKESGFVQDNCKVKTWVWILVLIFGLAVGCVTAYFLL